MTDLDWNLLAKYVSHECSDDECKRIQDWSEVGENKQLLEELIGMYNPLIVKQINLKKSMNKLTNKIKKDRLLKF
ncbi:MAG: hypothetical protein MJA30_05610 [Cytophagales bacterium]|nr:hypothetical protein [Cytophagales bacterium]